MIYTFSCFLCVSRALKKKAITNLDIKYKKMEAVQC